MPIRIPPARFQAWCRPSSTIISRAPLVRPPRTQSTTPLPAVYLHKMSTSASNTTSVATAPGSSGPAPTASTSPLPGNSPSHMSAAAGAGAGVAAPAAKPSSITTPTTAAHQSTVEIESEDQANNNNSKAKKSDGAIPTSSSSSSDSKPLPALPAPEDATATDGENGFRTVVVNGQAVALDNLGPMVVGRDGTVSRIANWPEMTDIERQNTLRILCKRNQLRLANLRAGLPADHQKPADEAS